MMKGKELVVGFTVVDRWCICWVRGFGCCCGLFHMLFIGCNSHISVLLLTLRRFALYFNELVTTKYIKLN